MYTLGAKEINKTFTYLKIGGTPAAVGLLTLLFKLSDFFDLKNMVYYHKAYNKMFDNMDLIKNTVKIMICLIFDHV